MVYHYFTYYILHTKSLLISYTLHCRISYYLILQQIHKIKKQKDQLLISRSIFGVRLHRAPMPELWPTYLQRQHQMLQHPPAGKPWAFYTNTISILSHFCGWSTLRLITTEAQDPQTDSPKNIQHSPHAYIEPHPWHSSPHASTPSVRPQTPTLIASHHFCIISIQPSLVVGQNLHRTFCFLFRGKKNY